MNKRKIASALLALIALTVPVLQNTLTSTNAEVREYGVDLAFKRRVVSSAHTDDHLNIKAVDGDSGTRYAAVGEDNAFFYVNLGSREKVGKVIIDWEAAYAAIYKIELSNDAINWTTVATVNKTNAKSDEIVFPVWIEAEYVRFQGVERALSYGYSFYSFEVYGPKSLAVGSQVLEVSSNEHETELNKNMMVDNIAKTRWASLSSSGDNQYFLLDLGEAKTFDLVKIRWEVSFARIFKIYGHSEVGNVAPTRSDESWLYLTGSETGLGEVDFLKLEESTTSRYLKVELIQRETSEETKKTGRYPWESTFSIYSFELFAWNEIEAVPVGNKMEFSKNSPAWTAMSNITLYEGGLILAPHGYPNSADGVVTNLDSIADGNIPGFESYATYNPAVIYDEDNEIFHMIYRSELPDNFNHYFGDKYELGHMSTLSYAYSYDGINFVRGENNPIAWPTTNDEKGGGLEDPRMVKVVNDPNRGGLTTYYITFTMYDNNLTREGVIYTHGFVTFNKVGRLSPDYGGAIKSGTYITDPEGNAIKIDDPRPGKHGQVYMIYMKDGSYTKIGFTNDVLTIAADDIVDVANAGFGGNDIEDITYANESCMALTNIYGPNDQDIYLMYGGGRLSDANIQNEQANVHGWFYALGALKTTKSNPFELTNVDMDLDEPTMYPTDTNKIDYGLFNKCMFADSMIRVGNTWHLYYGAGDMYVGLAMARADFSSGAATYDIEGSVLTATSQALNKKYNDDKTDYEIDYVLEVRDFDNNLLHSVVASYDIKHFSHSEMGKYSRGEDISVSLDLSSVIGLGSNYYVTTFVRDTMNQEVINNPSAYLVVNPTITFLD
ncbi:MAG: discoidin domain-containing protein [Bacilli bacterium]|nr:discoidin domain-containing protein [Bacilli bacterium]